MDQTTHEIQLANWRTIVKKCQTMPTDQTVKQCLAENKISEKQYYYWLRRVRKTAISETRSAHVPDAKQLLSVPFVKIPAQEVFSGGEFPAVTIKQKVDARNLCFCF